MFVYAVASRQGSWFTGEELTDKIIKHKKPGGTFCTAGFFMSPDQPS